MINSAIFSKDELKHSVSSMLDQREHLPSLNYKSVSRNKMAPLPPLINKSFDKEFRDKVFDTQKVVMSSVRNSKVVLDVYGTDQSIFTQLFYCQFKWSQFT